MKYPLLTLLAALSLRAATAQSTCTSSDATPIDGDVAFVAFWSVIAVDWVAIALWVKRSEPAALRKRGLTCSSTEECLSFRTVPFCYDKTTYTFHAADGTSGNFVTGEYTLPDGRVGNMYFGPYPTMTSTVAGAQPTTSTAQQSAEATTTSAAQQSAEATTSSAAGSSTASVQHAGSGEATSTSASVVATQSSALVLKSGGSPVVQMSKISWIIIPMVSYLIVELVL